MKNWFRRKRVKGFLLTALALILAIPLAALLFFTTVSHQIDEKMSQLRSSRASLFFALYPSYQVGMRFSRDQLRSLLEDQGFQEIKNPENLVAGTFALSNTPDGAELVLHRGPFAGAGHALEHLRARIRFENSEGFLKIKELGRLNSADALEKIEIAPKKISAFYAGRLRSQSPVALSDIPVSVRQAVMAIEDINFLEHGGVSPRSIVRAILKDIQAGKKAQGGSTITQQLMKNLYFSRQKSWWRKIREAVFAIVTEIKHSKEDILEAYLNEVYMGQWSTQEIHGVSEGARFYFNQSISDIGLSQAATLAALVQSPNAYDPHKDPTPLLKRRNLVLKKMVDAGFILKDEYKLATEDSLGIVPREKVLEDIGYFMDLVMKTLPDNIKNRLDTDALTIYTSLNPYLQSSAAKALKNNLDRLKKGIPAIKKKEARGIHLQSALIAVDIPNCSVIAVQGGSSYRQTQFNRVLQGKRQPGSLFKPYVFLAGFANPSPEKPITAVTELDGTQFEWKYDNQVWKPRNYEKEYPEKVTARKALEDSINVPTAHLAQMVGVPKIVDLITRSGIKSKVPVFPSISLGSTDVTPYELAEAYTTFANLGKGCNLRPVIDVFDENKNIVMETKAEFEERLPLVPTFQTVQLLKGVFARGTARYSQGSGVQWQYFAGKTGTTNDYKDAWFVGFSPQIMAMVWVGYDEEEKVGLTGAAAALPLWSEFMKTAQDFFPLADFPVPEGLSKVDVDPLSGKLATSRCPQHVDEYFVPGTEPRNSCPLH